MTDSIFTKIINREIPAEIVWENNEFIAILDIHPIQPGHTLLIPKKQVDKFYDLDEKTYARFFENAKFIAQKLDEVYQVKRTGLVIEGFGVPHAHIHLIPINHGNALNPEKTTNISPEELKVEAEKIRNALG